MAGTKKKKKPAANPARGFATTSIASKPRPETSETDANPASDPDATKGADATAPPSNGNAPPSTATPNGAAKHQELTAEEFEKQLEESELQLLVEKHAHKTRRDAQRQRTRLETDRRLLRAQADPINTPKWLPQELMDHILDLIKAESRFAATSLSSENPGAGKMPPEEDVIARLWTLQQTLSATAFPPARVEAAMNHILDIAPNVSPPAKDAIWGLEEALDWLARECTLDELPPYEPRVKPTSKGTTIPFNRPVFQFRFFYPLLKLLSDTPNDSPIPTRTTTPRPGNPQNGRKYKGGDDNGRTVKPPTTPRKLVVTFDGDIEPDDLIPEFIATRAKLLELERAKGTNGKNSQQTTAEDEDALAAARLEAKLRRIEGDVLFDKFAAEQQWKAKRVTLEKELAAVKRELVDLVAESADSGAANQQNAVNEDVNEEAERIAAEILADFDDDDDADGIGGLFDSLPQNEVDETTGKAQTVITSADGIKTVIRDFGKWTGVSPRRTLEEACRSRSVSLLFQVTCARLPRISWC